MGHTYRVGAGTFRFGKEKFCQPLIQPLEHDLLHRPHHIRKPFRCQFIEKTADMEIFLLELSLIHILLKRLHQERKMTCFFITHDLDVALYLADRVMVMRCGKIIEDRTFHGSTDCFTHPYTKLLLHSIAPYLG